MRSFQVPFLTGFMFGGLPPLATKPWSVSTIIRPSKRRINPWKALSCPLADPLERIQQAQRDDLARVQQPLGVQRHVGHRIVHPHEQTDDKLFRRHEMLLLLPACSPVAWDISCRSSTSTSG